MNYEQIVADTDQVIRDAIRRSDIMGAALMVITAIIAVMIVILMVEEIRAKRAARLANRMMIEYWSHVTDEADDGDRTWYRMGPAIKVVDDENRGPDV